VALAAVGLWLSGKGPTEGGWAGWIGNVPQLDSAGRPRRAGATPNRRSTTVRCARRFAPPHTGGGGSSGIGGGCGSPNAASAADMAP
jgi:hypothetical protein